MQLPILRWNEEEWLAQEMETCEFIRSWRSNWSKLSTSQQIHELKNSVIFWGFTRLFITFISFRLKFSFRLHCCLLCGSNHATIVLLFNFIVNGRNMGGLIGTKTITKENNGKWDCYYYYYLCVFVVRAPVPRVHRPRSFLARSFSFMYTIFFCLSFLSFSEPLFARFFSAVLFFLLRF